MHLDIYRPKPVPEFDLETNFVNSLGIISWFMPSPVSTILTTTSSWLSLLLPFLFSVAIDMVPPFFDVNLMALFIRLETVWLILSLSASIIN